MALAKERTAHESVISLIQGCSFYGNVYGGSPVHVSDPSSLELYGFDNYHKIVLEEGEGSEKTSGWAKNLAMSHPYSPSAPKESQSVINFKTGNDNFMYSDGSLLSFEQGEDYSSWADAVDRNYQSCQLNPKCGSGARLSEDLNCLETSSSFGSMNDTAKDDQYREENLGWLYSAAVATDTVQESGGQKACFIKRPHMGGDMQVHKKHCTGESRKPKPKSIPSKDPQSIAAKNRRERISERLKVLQDLVPNGTKVDLVTMLEKAISYVKFLQLQVKVLATDEFWPVQGGKAPEVAQVKEAIDAILSSHR